MYDSKRHQYQKNFVRDLQELFEKHSDFLSPTEIAGACFLQISMFAIEIDRMASGKEECAADNAKPSNG